MCLSIPAKIVEIDGVIAKADAGGNIIETNVTLVPGVEVGDYVVVHAGFAINRYDREEAEKTLEVLKEMSGGAGEGIPE